MKILFILIAISMFIAPIAIPMVYAETLDKEIFDTQQSFAEKSGSKLIQDGGLGLPQIVGVLVSTILMLVGVVFLSFTVYSGMQWMTAGGNEEAIKHAQARMKRAFIGLVVVLGAWIITSFIINALLGGPSSGSPSFNLGGWVSGGIGF